MRSVYLIFVLIACAAPVFAQFKNAVLQTGTSEGPSPTDPSIAINPKNPKNMVATASPNYIYYTVDGGLAWRKTTIAYADGVEGNLVVIATSKGDFYLFHRSAFTTEKKSNHLVCHVSGDGGQTWDEGSPIGQALGKALFNPVPAVDPKGNLMLTFTQADTDQSSSECVSNIMMSTSGNGKKWSKPFQLSQVQGNCKADVNTTRGAVPAVGGDDKLFATWSNQGKIFLDRSYDGGNLWLSNDIAITEQKGGPDLTIAGHPGAHGMPTLMIDNTPKGIARGSLYIVWADQRNGSDDADIWFMRSSNYGDNWTPPLRINNDGAGKQQFLPAMAIDQTTGFLYILYYDRRNADDLSTELYLAYSVDNGLKFSTVKISETPFTPEGNLGTHLGIAAHKGIITPVWTRADEGKTSIVTALVKHEELVKVK